MQAFAIMFSLLLAASSSLIVAVKGGGNGHMGIRHSAGGSDTVILHAQAAGRLVAPKNAACNFGQRLNVYNVVMDRAGWSAHGGGGRCQRAARGSLRPLLPEAHLP